MRLYNTALTSGTDDYMNELALEYTEDPDSATTAPLPTLVTRAALETPMGAAAEAALSQLASAAREALGTDVTEADAGAAPPARRVQRGDAEALLGWIAL